MQDATSNPWILKVGTVATTGNGDLKNIIVDADGKPKFTGQKWMKASHVFATKNFPFFYPIQPEFVKKCDKTQTLAGHRYYGYLDLDMDLDGVTAIGKMNQVCMSGGMIEKSSVGVL